jgi:small subunit ribosomal protein S19e
LSSVWEKGRKMTTAYDVPADLLIEKLSAYIRENVKEVTPPEWASYVKTGSHVERVPQRPDWWYIRSASLLRKLYFNSPAGVQRLRKEYGGRKRKGVFPAHFRKAGGSIIRDVLQQLEKGGLVDKVEKQGRSISRKGRGLLDAVSTQIKRDLDRDNPVMKAY